MGSLSVSASSGDNSPWEVLPVDLILEMISHVPFSSSNIQSLFLVNKRTHAITTNYEQSLSKTIASTQFPTAALVFPPPTTALPKHLSQPSFRWLSLLAQRTETISTLITITTSLSQDATYPLRHQTPHWVTIQRASLLLLYRLSDQPSRNHKITFLLSLPVHALALLHLELYLAIKIAEEVGEGVINASFARNDTPTRSDICLVFGELLLTHGPRFLHDILSHEPEATEELYREWSHLDAYQIDGTVTATTTTAATASATATANVGDSEDTPQDGAGTGTDERRRSLTSYLREAFGRRDGCGARRVSTRMWALVQSPVLWNMDELTLRRLVLGLEAKDGARVSEGLSRV